MKPIAGAAATTPDEVRGRLGLQPRRLLLIADLISVCVAALLLYATFELRDLPAEQRRITAVMAALTIVIALALLVRANQYTNRRRLSALLDVSIVARDLVVSVAVATLLNYLTKGFFTGITTPSRLSVISFVFGFFVLSIASRVGLSAYQRRLFARGRSMSKILVLGTGPAAADFLEFVESRSWLGIAVVGRVAYDAEDGPSSGSSPAGGSESEELTPEEPSRKTLPVAYLTDSVPGLQRLDQMLRTSGAAEVVVALDSDDQVQLPQVAKLLSLAHVPFKVVPSLFEQTFRATELLGFAEIPVIEVEVDPLDRVARFLKRTMDVCVAMGMLVLLLPLELLIVVAIMAESGLPVIYRQERVGKNGRHFPMYKFRTMVRHADRRLEELKARNEAEAGGRMFKMRKDPRVTRVGAVLRKFSLDELPQLINVLKKEMSVVGPRPPLPGEVEQYEQEHLYRLKALPGITGLWQVSGRSNLGFEDMVKLDRYYLDNWSVWLDAEIMLKTLFVVVTRKGAY